MNQQPVFRQKRAVFEFLSLFLSLCDLLIELNTTILERKEIHG